jgi:hypothetical protein
MPKETNRPIKELADLLGGSNAMPVVVPSRLAPSTTYDLDYRSAVIALVFEEFSKPFGQGTAHRISAAKLKLLQFATVRPWLLPAIREWSRGLAQGSLDLLHSVRIRRGFLSDTAHEDVINLLVASGIFVQQGNHVAAGEKVGHLAEIANSIRLQGLFDSERTMISQLAELKLTNSMLEGW